MIDKMVNWTGPGWAELSVYDLWGLYRRAGTHFGMEDVDFKRVKFRDIDIRVARVDIFSLKKL